MRAGRRHGVYATYSGGCRCVDCREANRLYQKGAQARRRQHPELADMAGHGKTSTYTNYSCRCAECRTANAATTRAQRAKKGGRR
jgi:hypothetical protein